MSLDSGLDGDDRAYGDEAFITPAYRPPINCSKCYTQLCNIISLIGTNHYPMPHKRCDINTINGRHSG